ncbi:MAG: hypothetical protein ABIO62_08195, partial [Paracoccaceae bacterium]
MIQKKANPGTPVEGVTGALVNETFETEHYRSRAEAATNLCVAIADCHPADAVVILQAAYDDLRAGPPMPTLIGIMAEADWWATWAAPIER